MTSVTSVPDFENSPEFHPHGPLSWLLILICNILVMPNRLLVPYVSPLTPPSSPNATTSTISAPFSGGRPGYLMARMVSDLLASLFALPGRTYSVKKYAVHFNCCSLHFPIRKDWPHPFLSFSHFHRTTTENLKSAHADSLLTLTAQIVPFSIPSYFIRPNLLASRKWKWNPI